MLMPIRSHAQALAGQGATAAEIVPIAGLAHDADPSTGGTHARCHGDAGASVARAGLFDEQARCLARANGAAFILLATEEACARLHPRPCVMGRQCIGGPVT